MIVSAGKAAGSQAALRTLEADRLNETRQDWKIARLV